MSNPPFSDGRLHVMEEKCETCVFRPGNLMHLAPGRLKQIVKTNQAEGSALVCHKTTYEQAEQQAICRGYFDTYKDGSQALTLAERMDIVEYVTPQEKP